MTESSTIEYKLQINLPELGSQDSFNVVIDLDSRPGLSSIIGNFYRFLLRIGVDREILDEFIDIPAESDLEEEEDIDWDDAKTTVLSEIEKSIMENSSDEKKKENFMKKIVENPEFFDQVFKSFLSSLMEDDEDEV